MEREGGQPCCHASLVCLSERCYGDRRPLLLVEQSLLPCMYWGRSFQPKMKNRGGRAAHVSYPQRVSALPPLVGLWLAPPPHLLHGGGGGALTPSLGINGETDPTRNMAVSSIVAEGQWYPKP